MIIPSAIVFLFETKKVLPPPEGARLRHSNSSPESARLGHSNSQKTDSKNLYQRVRKSVRSLDFGLQTPAPSAFSRG